VFLYYFLSSPARAGRQNKVPAFFAVWSANLIFAAVGIFLLWQMASGGRVLAAITAWAARLPKAEGTGRRGFSLTSLLEKLRPRSQRAKSRNAFPRILDEYVVREFLNMFLLVLAGFVLLMLVFTFFDLWATSSAITFRSLRSALTWLTSPGHALPDRAAGRAHCHACHLRRT